MPSLPAPHPDIARAHTLDARFYTDETIFAESKDRIFSRAPHFAGDASLIPQPGDCHPFTLLPGFLDEPLLLTRDGAGAVHLLSNVCTHRGATVVDAPCSGRTALRCPYHGRRFGLDGAFLTAPEFEGVQDFPRAEDSLHRLSITPLGPLFFTALERGVDAAAAFAPMLTRTPVMPLGRATPRPDLAQTFEVAAHWALYCENYLEGFHIPFVHAGLNAVLDFGGYTTETHGASILQIGIARPGEPHFEVQPDGPDAGRRVAAYYWFVFPNLMFNFYPWGLSLNVVEPIAPARTRVRFLSYVWDVAKLETGAGSGLTAVEHENEAVVESVQRGIRSRFYPGGRFSAKHEAGPHHFHRLLAAALPD